MAKKRNLDDYPEVKALIGRLKGGEPSDVLILFIPSRDRFHRDVPNRDAYQGEAFKLFGKLFRGATAFPGCVGIWRAEGNIEPHLDNVTMIETLTDRKNLTEENLYEFADFCRNMGLRMNQACVGVVLNNLLIEIDIKHED
jgi:hypothetical protein